jgi:hypothetical protein
MAKIMVGVEDRLKAAVSGDYLPKISYANIIFAPRCEPASCFLVGPGENVARGNRQILSRGY